LTLLRKAVRRAGAVITQESIWLGGIGAHVKSATADMGGSASYLGVKQEDDLKARVAAALPRSTR
jgi:hypothetical protein